MGPVHIMPQHIYLLLGSLFVLEEQIYKGQFSCQKQKLWFWFFSFINIFLSWRILSFVWQPYWKWKLTLCYGSLRSNLGKFMQKYPFLFACFWWSTVKLKPLLQTASSPKTQIPLIDFYKICWHIKLCDVAYTNLPMLPICEQNFWMWLWSLIWNVICKNV